LCEHNITQLMHRILDYLGTGKPLSAPSYSSCSEPLCEPLRRCRPCGGYVVALRHPMPLDRLTEPLSIAP
jgi:hypothetical protein